MTDSWFWSETCIKRQAFRVVRPGTILARQGKNELRSVRGSRNGMRRFVSKSIRNDRGVGLTLIFT